MSSESMNVFGYIALILTCTAASLHTTGIIFHDWRIITKNDSDWVMTIGILTKTICENSKCKTIIDFGKIKGGEEWLFICRVFAMFGGILGVLVTLFQLVYFCFPKRVIRAQSMYLLGCAGMFILMSVFIFIAMYQVAQRDNLNTNVEIRLGYPVGFSLVAGVFAIAAAILTAVSSIMAERDYEDFE